MRRARLMVGLLALAIVVAGCGSGDEPAGGDRPTVVATTTILGDVVTQIVGDEADVIVLMPIGADPHGFQPSAAQVADVNRADLVVANGLDLEEGLLDVLDAAADDGVRVLRVAPVVDPLPLADIDHDHDEEDGHEHDGDDPHVWLDPIRMAAAVDTIVAELTIVTPNVDWASAADAYADRLRETDREIRSLLEAVPVDRRQLVTNHESMGYFADRYGFEVLGTVIPGGATLADPSSEELADLVRTIDEAGVPAIFGETTEPSTLAEAVADELGRDIVVVSLYTGSLGEPGSGAESLIDMLLTNARLIADALG